LKTITVVKPLIFEDNLLLAFTKDWIEKFGKIPEFEIKIINKRLHIISRQTLGDRN